MKHVQSVRVRQIGKLSMFPENSRRSAAQMSDLDNPQVLAGRHVRSHQIRLVGIYRVAMLRPEHRQRFNQPQRITFDAGDIAVNRMKIQTDSHIILTQPAPFRIFQPLSQRVFPL